MRGGYLKIVSTFVSEVLFHVLRAIHGIKTLQAIFIPIFNWKGMRFIQIIHDSRSVSK